MSPNRAVTCARAQPDRRARPTPMFSRYWLTGRRRGGRRGGPRSDETVRIYVDGYTRGEWVLVFALFFLSTVDLVLTLAHVARGGSEANPVMAYALRIGGTAGFATAKILLTGAATLVLLLHVRFPLARRALALLAAGYVVLMSWHLYVAFDRLAS